MDHTIVGQSALTNFELRKDREYAFCRICGDIFQSRVALVAGNIEWVLDPLLKLATSLETKEWQAKHNKRHPDHVHKSFAMSGRFLSPEAAHKLAPYGVAPLSDMIFDAECEHAVSTAPRAPVAEVETR